MRMGVLGYEEWVRLIEKVVRKMSMIGMITGNGGI